MLRTNALVFIPMFMKWEGLKDFVVHVAWKEEFALEYKDTRFCERWKRCYHCNGTIFFCSVRGTLRGAGRHNKWVLDDCKLPLRLLLHRNDEKSCVRRDNKDTFVVRDMVNGRRKLLRLFWIAWKMFFRSFLSSGTRSFEVIFGGVGCSWFQVTFWLGIGMNLAYERRWILHMKGNSASSWSVGVEMLPE